MDNMTASPTSPCDIVMKGGVTSGVVYPALVVELAKNYRFMNIGGASVGAIAAACAAAAEYGRRHGNANAIKELDQVSTDLGKPGFIVSLFQPKPVTWGLFHIAIAAFGNASLGVKIIQVIIAAALGFLPLTAIAAIADAFILCWVKNSYGHDWKVWALGVLAAVVVLALAWVAGICLSVIYSVPANYLGLCTGSGTKPGRTPPLTDWLAQRINVIAGMSGSRPLTFGDLWGNITPAPPPVPYAGLPIEYEEPSQSLEQIRGDADINLEMMTTCLTLGQPFRLPLVTRVFFIHPDDAKAMFPKDVADWLLNNPAPPRSKEEAIRYRAIAPLIPLPITASFPIVVAARMSLSFPVLMSAVKLYSIDFSRPEAAQGKQLALCLAAKEDFDPYDPAAAWWLASVRRQLAPAPCWFSDGGLTHNFPVYFFDSPFPNWPTFAIDLDSIPEGVTENPGDDQHKFVWLPDNNRKGILPHWNRMEDQNGRASLFNFASLIFDTMQNWNDSTQAVMAGYRDRIAHIQLAQDEGGLNLDMRADVVKKLIERGRIAGDMLHQAFGAPEAWPPAPHWLDHRWVRYRSFMSMYERLLKSFHAKYSQTDTRPSYPDLIARPQHVDPQSYPWEYPTQAAFAVDATKKIDAVAAAVTTADASFQTGAPRPEGELTVRPVV